MFQYSEANAIYNAAYNVVQIQRLKKLLPGKLEERFRSVLNFPGSKSPKLSMSVIVIVYRNKLYKCLIYAKLLLFGRLNKFLLVINLTGKVLF